MKSLLVQSCSATKEPVDNAVPAIDLYDGYFFRIIKKALRADRFERGIDILIISAKYGVVEPDEEIRYYDRRMEPERAKELNADALTAIADKVEEKEYKKVWINLGKDYLPAVDGIESAVDVPVNYIEGCGIGIKGKRLKRLISNGQSTPVRGD